MLSEKYSIKSNLMFHVATTYGLVRNTLGSSSSVSAASLYIKLLMSRCERRRRPLDGEQIFKFDVEVVQVVDVVNVVV